jgi:V/A-type H+-transporting ATPase subunit E
MNCGELIASLWQKAEERIGAIIRETQEEEAKIEQDTVQRIGRLREEGEMRCSSEAGKRSEEILSSAEKEARMIIIAEKRRLSERLYRISLSSLPGLGSRGRSDMFRNLAAELPPLGWKTVRVNTADTEIAREHFPGAEIIADAGVSGGMEVISQDGKVRVINTLEKRLERAWGEIMPALMKEDYEAL